MNKPGLIPAHLDHNRSYDDFSYVYPVISRRSEGVSVGVNLNPDRDCNFHCVYCEVDRTQPPRRRDVDIFILAQELREMLKRIFDGTLFSREPFASSPPSWHLLKDIAFSGDGEPTTYPAFDQAVDTVWYVRESLHLESIKLVLITNASCLDHPGVRRGIRRMQDGEHEIWAKLDAGTAEYYQVVNRSLVPYAQILSNIVATARWCPLIIQSLFVRISGEPPSEQEIIAYTDRLNEIREQGGKILGLQLYTMARPATVPWTAPLSFEEMNRIAAMVRDRTGLPHLVFHGNAPT